MVRSYALLTFSPLCAGAHGTRRPALAGSRAPHDSHGLRLGVPLPAAAAAPAGVARIAKLANAFPSYDSVAWASPLASVSGRAACRRAARLNLTRTNKTAPDLETGECGKLSSLP